MPGHHPRHPLTCPGLAAACPLAFAPPSPISTLLLVSAHPFWHMHAEGRLAALGAWAGGSVGSAALRSPGVVMLPHRFSHVPAGAEQKIIPLWAVAVLCRLPGSFDSSFCFSYLNLLLETVRRAAILKLKGSTKGNV